MGASAKLIVRLRHERDLAMCKAANNEASAIGLCNRVTELLEHIAEMESHTDEMRERIAELEVALRESRERCDQLWRAVVAARQVLEVAE
jgi:gamma-glutamyl phosphate reductase